MKYLPKKIQVVIERPSKKFVNTGSLMICDGMWFESYLSYYMISPTPVKMGSIFFSLKKR